MKLNNYLNILKLKIKANIPKYWNHFIFYSTSAIDYILYIFFSKKKIDQSKSGDIIFATEDPRIDIVRYYKSLRNELSKNVVLFISHSSLDDLFLKVGFKEVIFFNNHWDFRRKIVKHKKVCLVHSFCRKCYLAMIVKKDFNLKCIISVKDTSVASFGLNPPRWYLRKEIPSERYALKHADAVLAESLEVCHASRILRVNSKQNRIYFPNYCDDDNMVERGQKLPRNELHFVYVGGIRGIQDRKTDHGNIQMHWLIEALDEQEVHFHIYPSPSLSRGVYEEYYQIEKEKKHFHMHSPLSPKEMNNEISKYHFGLVPFFHEDTGRAKEKRYYSSSLKIFNYIESSLPILISEDMGHQRWIMERYGMAYSMSKSDFYNVRSRVDMDNYEAIIDNLYFQRERLRLSNQIPRAARLYKQLQSD